MSAARTKTFFEYRYAFKVRGGPPGTWVYQDPAGHLQPTATLDDQVEAWVRETGHHIVFVSPPSVQMQWLDDDYQARLIVVGITLIYRPNHDYRPSRPEFPDPTPAHDAELSGTLPPIA